MNKISFSLNLKTVAALLDRVKSNFSLVLWVFLGIIIVLTGLVIYQEVRKVSSVQTDTAGILDRIVRVNMGQHESLEKKLGENSSFQPWPVAGADAFGPAPVGVE